MSHAQVLTLRIVPIKHLAPSTKESTPPHHRLRPLREILCAKVCDLCSAVGGVRDNDDTVRANAASCKLLVPVGAFSAGKSDCLCDFEKDANAK